jgi:Domain of unknown function (DUF6457)
MLEDWLRAAIRAAGVAEADPALAGADAVSVVLDLARDAAHGVARPAAPLATFAAGLAVGRVDGGLDDLRAVAARLTAAADGWRPTEETGATDGPGA